MRQHDDPPGENQGSKKHDKQLAMAVAHPDHWVIPENSPQCQARALLPDLVLFWVLLPDLGLLLAVLAIFELFCSLFDDVELFFGGRMEEGT